MTEEEKKALKYLRKNVIARIDIDKNGKEKIIGYGNAHKYIILKLIKKQQKEIEELQIIADDIKGHNIVYTDTPEFEDKFISKDKIREKIEELEKAKLPIEYNIKNIKITDQIRILEELLEE